MTNHPSKGRGFTNVTHFLCATVDLEKILHGTPLTAINNVADDGLLLIAPIYGARCHTKA